MGKAWAETEQESRPGSGRKNDPNQSKVHQSTGKGLQKEKDNSIDEV